MSKPLYEVAAEYRQQLDALAELDLDPQTLADTLEGLQGDLEHKLRAVIAYSLELDITAAGAEQAAKRMQERAKALRAKVDSLHAYALTAMRDTGLPGVETDEFAAKPAKNPASVEVLDLLALPARYMRQPAPPPASPDKAAIAADLKKGQEVPGARLVQSWRLKIA